MSQRHLSPARRFVRGDQYAVSLGLVEDGVVVAGVLGCPNMPTVRDRPDTVTMTTYCVRLPIAMPITMA